MESPTAARSALGTGEKGVSIDTQTYTETISKQSKDSEDSQGSGEGECDVSVYRGGATRQLLTLGSDVDVVEGPGTFYIGIIDVLQEWNFHKKAERFVKTVLLGKDGKGLSAINASSYRERFMARAVRNVIVGWGSGGSTIEGIGNVHTHSYVQKDADRQEMA
jgi:hypothetical protein